MTTLPPTPDSYSVDELACELGVGVPVVAFWQQEFGAFFAASQEGRFSEEALRTGRTIQTLLYEECFTLRGVKRQLKKIRESAFLVDREWQPDKLPLTDGEHCQECGETQVPPHQNGGVEPEVRRDQHELVRQLALREVAGLLELLSRERS